MIQWYEVLAVIGIVVLFELITLAIGYHAEKLHAILDKYDAEMLDFKPQTPIGLLRAQLSVMCSYMAILEERAEFEGIDLSILADREE